MSTSTQSTVYGYPRQGRDRELKKAIESYWNQRSSAEELLATAEAQRRERLQTLAAAGINEIPINDFSLYDHVLDTAWLLGAVPQRYRDAVPDISTPAGRLDRYFALARGNDSVQPLEMTKWFDTNYHYLVPELGPDTAFDLDPAKPLEELAEARELGVIARPVLLGPITFLLLSKGIDGANPLDLLDRLLPLYADLLGQLHAAGAEWVQLDEPILVLDQPQSVLDRVATAYADLGAVRERPQILVASYFERLREALPVLASAPIEGLALDLTGPALAQLTQLAQTPGLGDKRVVAGVVDGRNIWRTDLDQALAILEQIRPVVGRLDVAPSCSLLHVPIDVHLETDLDPEVAHWLAFADQKLDEISVLVKGLRDDRAAVAGELHANAAVLENRRASTITHDDAVRRRAEAVTDDDLDRGTDYAVRRLAQQERLHLPEFPTTTIGSFPQTSSLRQARAALRRGKIDRATYDTAMEDEIRHVVELQENIGLDVLVHGEPERNDMVQYFAEQLQGYVATQHGWVQSYGTRCVRPPIIVGDVSRPAPMTVRWAQYAQGLTDQPVKGMLTGPVTMLAWSFVRDDQPAAETAHQVALALRDEVDDLEAAGIAVIQVDEPALRETLPLRTADRSAYLDWAVDAFRLATAGVSDATQVHTHMCYAEFGDVLPAIIALDADVISLEAARSRMEIVAELAEADYPREVGPGVWDIHSPRVPEAGEVINALRLAAGSLPAERIWVNPDCGLKTRGYDEVKASLVHLVEAARSVRH